MQPDFLRHKAASSVLPGRKTPGDTEISASIGHTTPITIFVHIFHLEIWPEILADLDNFPLPYQLVLTGPHTPAAVQLPANPTKVEFHETANSGRDIGPFLKAFRETQLTTDICLKLHTKKSLHLRDGEIWRKSILSDLLPGADGVRRTVRLLHENPKVGLVAPNGHLVPICRFLGANEALLKNLFQVYGIDADETDMSKALFAAGSMFWFRSAAFMAVQSRSSAIEFESERGQLDGTRAHAHERIFSLLAEHTGFVSVTMGELTQRAEPAYQALSASERAKKDAALFHRVREPLREPLGVSAFLTPSSRQTGLPRAQQLYRKLPVGFRLFVRRILGLPH